MQWPHTKHIKDLLRCSVVFDSVTDLYEAVNAFKKRIEGIPKDSRQCITRIVRIKNGFGDFSEESWNGNVESFGYRDIKFNFLLRNKLIAECVCFIS